MIGVNCAIILQKLQFLLSYEANGKVVDGEKYIFNTYEQWQKTHFDFWSISTIERGFTSLESMGLIASIQPEGRASRRKYYRVTEATFTTLTSKNVPDDLKMTDSGRDRLNLMPSEDLNLMPSCAGASFQSKKTTKNTEVLEEKIPKSLDTPDFRSAWDNYLGHRKDNKFSTLKPRSVSSQFREMEKWGVVAAISAIENTIRNNYQGIFEPKANGNGKLPAKKESLTGL